MKKTHQRLISLLLTAVLLLLCFPASAFAVGTEETMQSSIVGNVNNTLY